MKRSGFKTRAPDRAERADRSAEFASVVLERPRAVMATPQSIAAGRAQAPAPQKLPRQQRTDDAIRQSAQGEDCHMRLDGVCNSDPATTVWSHWPGLDADRGMGIKALDAAGCYCCSACHDVIDQRTRPPAGLTRNDVVLAWMFGHLRSLVTLARKGLL